jgi:uncharacterized protein YacL (UPF0231 family)
MLPHMNIDGLKVLMGNVAAESNHNHAVAGDWKNKKSRKKGKKIGETG